ncbi:GNAT family N-acetyltransferase [Niveibacterium sp. COAC-50]|uniref:GNAT family N-acetyltransferase n=1 Tax=Niveibacterium sp. COAC-50 TaxID=2729384 RepID=UPI0015557776|nr:GNAT family N-acetyltransferase [Niveibacterium sp. COAC-50]
MQEAAPALDDAATDDALVDALLALELLTRRASGLAADAEACRARIAESLPVSQLCQVWRDGRLVAYGMVTQQTATSWFVTAFAVHPSYRTAGVLRELLGGLASLIEALGIEVLWSYVYKANPALLRLHRALGFEVQRENATGVEFRLPLIPSPGGARLARLLRSSRA